jgi:hypothetical protein
MSGSAPTRTCCASGAPASRPRRSPPHLIPDLDRRRRPAVFFGKVAGPIQPPRAIPIPMMMTFWEWLGQGYEHGFVQEFRRLFREGDEGYQAFLDQTNAAFRAWIGTLLRMGKFTDPRNEAEARAIVDDPTYFNYAQELLAAAAGGRARLQGQDVLDGAQEVNGQLWMRLLDPKLYEPKGATWESRNPLSAGRGGIRGTIRSWARNMAGHFAYRLNKRRTGVTTRQFSQVRDTGSPFRDPPARPQESDLEWEDLKRPGDAVAEGGRGPGTALAIQGEKPPLGGGNRQAADGDTVGVAIHGRGRRRDARVAATAAGWAGGPVEAQDRPGPEERSGRGQAGSGGADARRSFRPLPPGRDRLNAASVLATPLFIHATHFPDEGTGRSGRRGSRR